MDMCCVGFLKNNLTKIYKINRTCAFFINLHVYPSCKIVASVGNDLVSPNLMPNQTMNGERLGKLFTQKTVWLIPNKNVALLTFTIQNIATNIVFITRIYNQYGILCTR